MDFQLDFNSMGLSAKSIPKTLLNNKEVKTYLTPRFLSKVVFFYERLKNLQITKKKASGQLFDVSLNNQIDFLWW